MNEQTAVRIRIDLARGHWALGEREQALASLEQAAAEAPKLPELLKLVDEMLLDGPDPRLEALLAKGRSALAEGVRPPDHSPLSTPTLAQLLAEQGHTDRAREVAEDVLRRNPDDSRALEVRRRLAATSEGTEGGGRRKKIDILEHLLARIQKRRSSRRRNDLS